MLFNLCVSSEGVCFATLDPIDHEEAPNAFTEDVLNINKYVKFQKLWRWPHFDCSV